MIAAVSVAAAAAGLLSVAVALGRWARSVEDRLQRYQADLHDLGEAMASLRRHDAE